jgi:hypothetical protein
MKQTLTALILFCNTLVLYPQVILTIEGEEIIDTETGASSGFNVPRSEPTTLIFRNNLLDYVNASGYMLQAGDETPGTNNNNLDGEIITGNRFIWNGTDEDSWTHSVFTGYNIDVILKYNYLDRTPNGIQRKSNGMTDFTGVIAYNVIKNPRVGIVVKGINGIKIFNNTFYSDKTPAQTYRALIDIHTNTDGGLNATSTGTKIFNNIFYTRNRVLNIWVYEEACLEGFESDYNIFWCETGEPVFRIGDKFKSFSQWQDMGYDKHSVVLNPNFNNFTDFVPAQRLDHGTNLGESLIDGLAIDAVWSNVSPRTAVQNDKWQVGARIYEGEVVIEEPLGSATRIYPSPAQVFFYILNNDPDRIYSTMKIYDSRGRVVMQQPLIKEINIVNLPAGFASGLYTVVLEGIGSSRWSKKIIIVNETQVIP